MMTEWGVFGVIVGLLGLLGTVCVPMLRLNTSITRLTITMETLQTNLDREHEDNRKTHERLWNKADRNAERIEEHERRLSQVETRNQELGGLG